MINNMYTLYKKKSASTKKQSSYTPAKTRPTLMTSEKQYPNPEFLSIYEGTRSTSIKKITPKNTYQKSKSPINIPKISEFQSDTQILQTLLKSPKSTKNYSKTKPDLKNSSTPKNKQNNISQISKHSTQNTQKTPEKSLKSQKNSFIYDKENDIKHEFRNWYSPNKSPIRHVQYKNIVIRNRSTSKIRQENPPVLNQLLESDNLFEDLFQTQTQSVLDTCKSPKNNIEKQKFNIKINYEQSSQNYDQIQQNNLDLNMKVKELKQLNSPLHEEDDRKTDIISSHQSPQAFDSHHKNPYLINNSEFSDFKDQSQQNQNKPFSEEFRLPSFNQNLQNTLELLQKKQQQDEKQEKEKNEQKQLQLDEIIQQQQIQETPKTPKKINNSYQKNLSDYKNSRKNFKKQKKHQSEIDQSSILSLSQKKQNLSRSFIEIQEREVDYERQWAEDPYEPILNGEQTLQNCASELTIQKQLNSIDYLQVNIGSSQTKLKEFDKQQSSFIHNSIDNFDKEMQMKRIGLYNKFVEDQQQEIGDPNVSRYKYSEINKSHGMDINNNSEDIKSALKLKCPHLVKAMYCNICSRRVKSQLQHFPREKQY